MSTADERRRQAQVEFREQVMTKTGPEKARAKREWQARWPDMEDCQCTGGNVRYKRRPR